MKTKSAMALLYDVINPLSDAMEINIDEIPKINSAQSGKYGFYIANLYNCIKDRRGYDVLLKHYPSFKKYEVLYYELGRNKLVKDWTDENKELFIKLCKQILKKLEKLRELVANKHGLPFAMRPQHRRELEQKLKWS
jgi:hypothetical protein